MHATPERQTEGSGSRLQGRPLPPSLREPARSLMFSREGVRALDASAERELRIPTLLLMENAAQSLEDALDAWGLLPPNAGSPRILIACGPGNNGGDGLALARRLFRREIDVRVLLACDAARLKGDALANYRAAHELGVPIEEYRAGTSPVAEAHAPSNFGFTDGPPTVIVDALFGTGLDRTIGGPEARFIARINAARASAGVRVVAVDVPSGLDTMTGEPVMQGSACVEADLTVTLAGMKPGLAAACARPWTGEVVVGSIGLPASFMRRFAAV